MAWGASHGSGSRQVCLGVMVNFLLMLFYPGPSVGSATTVGAGTGRACWVCVQEGADWGCAFVGPLMRLSLSL